MESARSEAAAAPTKPEHATPSESGTPASEIFDSKDASSEITPTNQYSDESTQAAEDEAACAEVTAQVLQSVAASANQQQTATPSEASASNPDAEVDQADARPSVTGVATGGGPSAPSSRAGVGSGLGAGSAAHSLTHQSQLPLQAGDDALDPASPLPTSNMGKVAKTDDAIDDAQLNDVANGGTTAPEATSSGKRTEPFLAASPSSQPLAGDDAAPRTGSSPHAISSTAPEEVSLPEIPFDLQPPTDSEKPSATSSKPTIQIDQATFLSTDATKTLSTTDAHGPVIPHQAVPAPEQQFAVDNHPKIVTTIRSALLPNGGTMHIRLDPPELGALQISISMRDGVMNASFQTSNDEATHLLSHSLSQLKTVLETQGVSVDRIHVQQAPRNEHANNSSSDEQRHEHGQANDSPARREQERRDLLRRMWRKLAEGSDPLDLVA